MKRLVPRLPRLFALAGFALLTALVVRALDQEPRLPDGLYAEFTTAHGPIIAQLFYDRVPMTCASFVGLTEGTLAPRNGRPFYTGLRWYRVVPGFVIQSGDPTTPHDGIQERSARGEPEDPAGHPYSFPDEFAPGLRHDSAGVLSMANDGADTNSSEFFLTLAPTNRLNYLHTVFGRVVRGVELLPQIVPDEPFSIRILRVGAPARAFKADDATFKALVAKAKKYTFAREPGPEAHFDDPDRLLPLDPPRAKAFNFKLGNFERATGIKIVARLFSKSPPAAEDEKPGAYMRALATKLGVDQRGVLVAYFADEADWRVWIGDELTARFVGRPGTAKELTASGAIHDVKEAFLKAAQATGDADFDRQQKAAAPDKQPPPGQRIKLQADAVLDGLIDKFEPAEKR